MRRHGWVRVINARQTVLLEVGLTRPSIHANPVSLENSADLIIFLLQDRIVHMVMAPRAVDRHALESEKRVLHGVLKLIVPVVEIEIAGKVTGGAQVSRV